jgi:hypothetical protein
MAHDPWTAIDKVGPTNLGPKKPPTSDSCKRKTEVYHDFEEE